jgi:delta 1-pyrroline-5-carboxylate dehydrogenase
MTPAAILAAVAKWPAWLKFEFEERAAIIQYEAKMSKDESERLAFALTKPKSTIEAR